MKPVRYIRTQHVPTGASLRLSPSRSLKTLPGRPEPSSYGFPNDASNITINHGSVPNHDPALRAGQISWTTGGTNTYFQTNWTAVGHGMPTSAYKTLEIRVSRQSSSLNPTTPTDFSISIKGSCNASTGTVKLSHYTDPNFVGQAGHQSFLQGPEGSTDGGLHSTLHTVRIPLTDFPGYGNAFSTRVPGIRLTFDQSSQGAIYVANIRLSAAAVTSGPEEDANDLIEEVQQSGESAPPHVIPHSGVITMLRRQPALPQLARAPAVEIGITSPDLFPVRDRYSRCVSALRASP